MSAWVSILPRVETQPAAGEVEHLEGVVGPLGVTVRDRMPLSAVGATDVRALAELGIVLPVHAPTLTRSRDTPGQNELGELLHPRKTSSNRAERTIVTKSDPRHPSRLEKKTNTYRSPRSACPLLTFVLDF